MTTKRQGQMKHALKRVRQRYGLTLSESEVRAIGNMIRRGDAERVRRQSERVSVYRVCFSGVTLLVAYDYYRHQVCTFLPEDEVYEPLC